MTAGMPMPRLMVVVLGVTVGARCCWARMPVSLGLNWFRHSNQEATKSQGCSSSHSGDRESLFHELIGSMHLL